MKFVLPLSAMAMVSAVIMRVIRSVFVTPAMRVMIRIDVLCVLPVMPKLMTVRAEERRMQGVLVALFLFCPLLSIALHTSELMEGCISRAIIL